MTIHLTLAREHWDTLKENLQNIDTIEPREYQTNIVNEAKDCNSLVILPTALGKTFIAMRIAMQRLQLYPWGKVIVLAPTRPLVNQHLNTFKVFLAGSHLKCSGRKVLSFFEASGRIPSKKRAGMYGNANFIFATPQTLKNDIQRGSCSLHDCVLLVLDECHKTGQKYAYNHVAFRYMMQNTDPIILGLTASPGRNKEKILDLCKRLYIEKILIRTHDDVDVEPYIHPINLEIEYCSLPHAFLEMKSKLRDMVVEKVKGIQRRGFLRHKHFMEIHKMDVIKLGQVLWAIINEKKNALSPAEQEALDSMEIDIIKKDHDIKFFSWLASIQAQCIKLFHLLELITTQCLHSASRFLRKISDVGRSSANAILLNDSRLQEVMHILSRCLDRETMHPKMELVLMLAGEILYRGDKPGKTKIIIFAQFRDTVMELVDRIEGLNHGKKSDNRPFRPAAFIGQSGKEDSPGMSQKEQSATIEDFKQGRCNILIATRIAEEGLDIPAVDHIIFYEPIPSEIRYIQRRGRTGRHAAGNVTILVTEDTLDQVFLNVAFHRYNKMKEIVRNLRGSLLREMHRVPLGQPRYTEPLECTRITKQQQECLNDRERILMDPNMNIGKPGNTKQDARDRWKRMDGILDNLGITRITDLVEGEHSINWHDSLQETNWHEVLKKMSPGNSGNKKTYRLKRTRKITRFLNKTMEWIYNQLENLGNENNEGFKTMSVAELEDMAEFEELDMDDFEYNLNRGIKKEYWQVEDGTIILLAS